MICGCVTFNIEHVATSRFGFLLTAIMDLLHTQLRNIENRLSFVKTEAIDWKLYVQVFAWTVTFFESYLLYVFFLRQGYARYDLTDMITGFDNIRYTRKPHPQRRLRSTLILVSLRNLKNTVKTKPSLLYSLVSTSSLSKVFFCTMDSMRGPGLHPVISYRRLDMVRNIRYVLFPSFMTFQLTKRRRFYNPLSLYS